MTWQYHMSHGMQAIHQFVTRPFAWQKMLSEMYEEVEGTRIDIIAIYCCHYDDVIMSVMASHITGVSIVCSTLGAGADQRNHQSSASLAFVWGIHRWPVNSPHKRTVTRKMFPSDNVIMQTHYYHRNLGGKQFVGIEFSGNTTIHPV